MATQRFAGENTLKRLVLLAGARESLAVLVAIGLSLAIITTIYSNIRSVEEALPRFGFMSFRELHAHIRDVDRLKDMVLLMRADPESAESRALLAEAADLAYIRFAEVDRSRITAEMEVYAGLRDTIVSVVQSIDAMLAEPRLVDRQALRGLTTELERVETELNREYYSVGEESNRGLHAAQMALNTLNTQILGILAVLSTLLIGVALLLVQRQRVAKKLRKLAWHDAVTGLKNRAWLMEKSGKFILDAEAAHKFLAVYLIDLDHFKQVNDTLGHHAGDKLLQVVSDRLREHNRYRAAAAIRLGGDEFAFIKAADNAGELVELGETLCAQLSRPIEVDGYPVAMTASIGLSWYPEHGEDISLLLKRADLALYAAKADGRQRMVTYSPALKAHSESRFQMEAKIRRGMEADEFFLVWQPQLSVSTGRLTGVEALLRWDDPDAAETVQPLQFLSVAEHSDLIVDIDRMVLREACLTAAKWSPLLGEGFTVSVNISTRSLQDREFCAFLTDLLAETGVPASRLELDVPESAFSRGDAVGLDTLTDVRQLGVRTALDDFGTGHANLVGWAEWDLDRIKLDRAFLSRLDESPRRRELVRTLLSLCQSLDVRTLAKGVENARQLDFLAATNCTDAQGFYISEPLSATLFSDYIRGEGQGPAKPADAAEGQQPTSASGSGHGLPS